MFRSRKYLLILLIPVYYVDAANDNSKYINRAIFDVQALKENGLDPALAEYYAFAPRFSAGKHTVNLKVNGNKVGLVDVTFDNLGKLCATNALLNQVHIKENGKNTGQVSSCRPLSNVWENAIVDLDSAMQEVDIIVPAEAIDYTSDISSMSFSGGSAGMVNYTGYSMRSRYNHQNIDRYQGNFELGFNSGDWIFRSTQLLSDASDSAFSHSSLFTYAQRTFRDYGKLVQLGEINIINTRFSIPSIKGVQWVPDISLASQGGSGVDVNGIAHTQQAQVEVRQGGALIYSTLVPAGPFTLPDIPIISGTTNLDVTVKESNHDERHFTIAASTFRGNLLNQVQGFSLAAGRVKQMDTRQPLPWVVSASDGWMLNKRINATGGMLIADDRYYGFSATVNAAPFQYFYTTLGYQESIDNDTQTDGQKFTIDANYTMSHGLTLLVGGSYSDRNYRELSQLYGDNVDSSPMKYENNIGLSWNHDFLGGFSVNYYQGEAWDSYYDNRQIGMTWSRAFGSATINVNWQSDISRSDENDDNLLYISLSVPLDGAFSDSLMRSRQHGTTYGTRLSGSFNSNNQYVVGVERNSDGATTSWNAALNSNLHYTNLALTTDRDNRDNGTWSATLQGGAVAHAHGITFSPWNINDTFGIVSLDKPISGVEISTMRGPVWTDQRGMAVIPALSPWQNSPLDLNTQTLPGNVDVKNGKASLNVAHGAVANWQFATLSQRRTMLTVKLPDGSLLPKGTSIVDEDGRYITTAPDEGLVFLNNISVQQHLYVLLNGGRCFLQYLLPQEESDLFYEEVNAECVAIVRGKE